MPYQSIYKDVGIGTEATYGMSIAATSRIHIRSLTFNLDQNKELVEDTISSSRGRDRLVRRRNTIEGDIEGYSSPRTLHHMLELVNGVAGATAALGNSAMIITYPQNVTGTMLSKTINIDRNNTTEAFNGVYASSLELRGSDDLVEFTLSGGAQIRGNGAALPDNVIGETVHPYSFSDVTVTIHRGATYGAQSVTHPVSEWSVTYENGMEPTYLSGSPDIARVDPKIPTVTGKLKIFHTGASWVDATYGASEFYLRFDATLPSQAGLIAGVTPYALRIDIPRAQLRTNIRNYEQNEFAVEEIEFVGLMDLSPVGTSSLWKVSQTVDLVTTAFS